MRKFTLTGAVRWSMNATSIHSYTLQRDISPENDMSVIVYSPSSCSKPAWLSLCCGTSKDILKTREYFLFIQWKSFASHRKKEKTYMFDSIWGWVNESRRFIFGWTISLMQVLYQHSTDASKPMRKTKWNNTNIHHYSASRIRLEFSVIITLPQPPSL